MNIKICTSIKQSKKLIELGVDMNTADMRLGNYVGKSGKVDGTNVHYYTKEESFGAPEIIPAWSLSALLELIPESIDDNTDDFSQLQLTKKSVAYYYGDGALRHGYLKDNLINAAFEMVVWLKENNKI